MQPPLICQSCGTVLSAPGGRCPSCGALQPGSDEVTLTDLTIPAKLIRPDAYPSSRPRTSPSVPPDGGLSGVGLTPGPGITTARPNFSRPPPAAPQSKIKPLYLVVPLLLILATTVTLAIVRGAKISDDEERAQERSAAAAAAAASAAVEAEVREQQKAASRISAVWADATTRAKVWHRDAILIRMDAGPLDAQGQLDAENGKARLEFAVPASADLPPRSGASRFVVEIDAQGTRGAETKGQLGVASAAEPACPSEEVLRLGPVSGAKGPTRRIRAS
jgi:hypothetical protein